MQDGSLKYYLRPARLDSAETGQSKEFVLIDFSYQMRNQYYITDSYTNFTLHAPITTFVKQAAFILPDEKIALTQINTLDRNVAKQYLRVGTVLPKDKIKTVFNALKEKSASLQVVLEDGTVKSFLATDEISERINEAFLK